MKYGLLNFLHTKTSQRSRPVENAASGANKGAIDEINGGTAISITVRQAKYLNNIVEQDHRAIKRLTRPMRGFKSFRSAANVLAGVELMHMIARASSRSIGVPTSVADQFYALAGLVLPA